MNRFFCGIRFAQPALLALVAVLLSLPAVGQVAPSLDQGFHLLYNLDFADAEREFSSWQKLHPDDAMGPVAEASGQLFAEFNRLGILESQFFVSDSKFEHRTKLDPDPAVRRNFDDALNRADGLVRSRLARDPNDHDALFASALSAGLRADYAALVEKRNLASLQYTRESQHTAEKLLALDPERYDAYLATGISRYLIGSMSAPMRWILRMGGVSGDKQQGINELELTAQKGHYLAPFARILLSIAYLREKDRNHARLLLANLQQEFPANPLFSREIARIDSGTH